MPKRIQLKVSRECDGLSTIQHVPIVAERYGEMVAASLRDDFVVEIPYRDPDHFIFHLVADLPAVK